MNYADPNLWDYLWSISSAAQMHEMLQKVPPATNDAGQTVLIARQAQVMSALNQDEDALDLLDEALERYEGRPGVDVALLRAVRLVVLFDLNDTAEVLRTRPVIQGLAPLRVEAALLSHYAYGMALASSGESHAALVSLARAEGLAGQMGLTHRTTVYRTAIANMRQRMGDLLDPEEILMESASRHAPTAAWGVALAASAMLKRGEYRRAHSLASNRQLRDLCLMAALAGVAPHPAEEGNDRWSRQLAEAIRAAEDGRYDDMPILEPHRDDRVAVYGNIVNGLRALRAYRQTTSVDAALGEAPTGKEQRALWGIVRLAAVLEDQAVGNLVTLAEDLLTDLSAIPYPADVLRLMERLLPAYTLLLTYFPRAHTVPSLTAIRTPILVGDVIRGPTRIEIHGPTADTLIAKSLGEKIVINTGNTSRTRTKLRGLGIDMDRMATVGHMYIWLSKISRAAQGTPRAQEWQASAQAIPASSPRLRQILASSFK